MKPNYPQARLSYEGIVEGIFPRNEILENENGSTKKAVIYEHSRFDAHLMAHGIDAFYNELIKTGVIFDGNDDAVLKALNATMKSCKKGVKAVSLKSASL